MEVDKHCGIPPVERERGNPMEMESMEAEVGKEANGGIQLLYIKIINNTPIPYSFLCFLTKELTACRSSRSSRTSEAEVDLAPISFWRNKHICDKT